MLPIVVTLCSGIEAVIQGYENLMIEHVHAAACESDEDTAMTLLYNFHPQQMFYDLTELNPRDLPLHDMLWAGFPCQCWSAEGAMQGFDDDKGRGMLILYIINCGTAGLQDPCWTQIRVPSRP